MESGLDLVQHGMAVMVQGDGTAYRWHFLLLPILGDRVHRAWHPQHTAGVVLL